MENWFQKSLLRAPKENQRMLFKTYLMRIFLIDQKFQFWPHFWVKISKQLINCTSKCLTRDCAKDVPQVIWLNRMWAEARVRTVLAPSYRAFQTIANNFNAYCVGPNGKNQFLSLYGQLSVHHCKALENCSTDSNRPYSWWHIQWSTLDFQVLVVYKLYIQLYNQLIIQRIAQT